MEEYGGWTKTIVAKDDGLHYITMDIIETFHEEMYAAPFDKESDYDDVIKWTHECMKKLEESKIYPDFKIMNINGREISWAMKSYDKDFLLLFEENPNKWFPIIKQQLPGMIKELIDIGMMHDDLALRNIMADSDGKLHFIDYNAIRLLDKTNLYFDYLKLDFDLNNIGKKQIKKFISELTKLFIQT